MSGDGYLESMRDNGDIALFWEGYQAGNGWNLFEGPGHVLEWFEWLLADEQLDQFGIEKKAADSIRPLLAAAEEARSGRSPQDEERFLDRANEFIWKYEEMQWGKYDASGHKFYSFRRLVTDPDFVEEFSEYLESEGLPQRPPEKNLDAFEAMLGRVPGPGCWTPS